MNSLRLLTHGGYEGVNSMTTDERLDRLEDAVADLADIMERRHGRFENDVDATVQVLGERFHAFTTAVAAERT
jgi:hypothetical protein